MGKIFFFIIAVVVITILVFVVGSFLDLVLSISITGYPNLDSVIVLAMATLVMLLIRKAMRVTLSVLNRFAERNIGKISREFWLRILDWVFVFGIGLAVVIWLFDR